jgi:hypothetical protein
VIGRLRELMARPIADHERRPAALIACALILALAIGGWWASGRWGETGPEPAPIEVAASAGEPATAPALDAEAQRTARAFARAYLGVDHRAPERHLRALRRWATPRMHLEAAGAARSEQLRELLRRKRTRITVAPGRVRLDEAASSPDALWVRVGVTLHIREAGRVARQPGELALRLVRAPDGSWQVERVGQ